MSTNFQSSGAPPRPAGVLQDPLPYPYVTQWNEQQQATYYANSETGETFWHPPNFGDQGGQLRGPGGIVNSASLRLGNPELKTAGASSQPGQPAPAVQNDRVRSGGEAASFYAGSGNVPQDPNARLTAAPPEEGPTSTNRAFGNESDERAQFGKALGGGGVAAMAWNLYKAYRNGKHNQQQFQPPSGSPPMFGGVGTSSLFGSGAGQSMFGEGNSNMRPPAGMYGPSGQYGHGSSHYSQHGRPQNSLTSGLLSALDGSTHHGPPSGGHGFPGGGMFGDSSYGGRHEGPSFGHSGPQGQYGGPPGPGGFGGPQHGGGGGRW